MNTFSSIILGIVQGLTEFLPISSSGHLVLFQNLLGFKEPELLLDVSLHVGTLLAVCIYFHSDLASMFRETLQFILDLSGKRKRWHHLPEVPHAALTFWVLVGTLPTLVIGLAFRSYLEALFGSLQWVGIMLICTGLILIMTLLMPKNTRRRPSVGLFVALAVGTAQGMALIPGISRSGATIVCGLLCKMKRDLAARFSFLLSIPAIFGALVLQLSSNDLSRVDVLPLLFGFFVSTIIGLVALKILMGVVKKGRLYYFAPYCWTVGLIIIIMSI